MKSSHRDPSGALSFVLLVVFKLSINPGQCARDYERTAFGSLSVDSCGEIWFTERMRVETGSLMPASFQMV